MNLLMTWFYPLEDKIIDKLTEELNITKCLYTYSEKSEIISKENFEGIYLKENLSFYEKNRKDFKALDQKILDELAPYEEQCMNIINRWKSSYVTDYSYSSLRELYYTFVTYWNNLIEKNQIECYVLNILPHVVPTFFAYVVCKVKRIPIVMLNYMPFISQSKGKYILTTGYEDIDPYYIKRLNEYNELAKKGEMFELVPYFEDYFKQYLNKNNKEVKRVIGYNIKKSVGKTIKSLGSKGIRYVKQKEYGILVKKIKYILTLRESEKKFLKCIEKYEQDLVEDEKFVFFPLHMQPEATTLPLGGWFVNQFLVIKMLSSALPKGVMLYVKEHPVYWTRNTNFESIKEGRNEVFYRKIKELHNVRLIRHDYSSLDLMDKMSALVTITGTAGFEAFFKGKAVIFFGNVPYNKFIGAYTIKTNDDCRRVLSEILNGEAKKYNAMDIRVYLKTLEKYSLTLGSTDIADIENGVPEFSKEDQENLANKIIMFYKDVYENV